MGERHLLLASILIPRFNDMSWINSEKLKETVNQWLKEEIAELQITHYQQDSTSTSESEDFFPKKKSQNTSCNDLVDQYFTCSNSQLTCLQSFPELKKLFLKYNTLLPSSAPVERLLVMVGTFFEIDVKV